MDLDYYNIFEPPDADHAHASWGCNCGPAALAALIGVPCAAVRPHLGDFERRRYTNGEQMMAACRSAGLGCRYVGSPDEARQPFRARLARVQFGGPWLNAGVPVRARFRYTHWFAGRGDATYDVNVGFWINLADWADQLAPQLARAVSPRCDGTWSVTSAVVVDFDTIAAVRGALLLATPTPVAAARAGP